MNSDDYDKNNDNFNNSNHKNECYEDYNYEYNNCDLNINDESQLNLNKSHISQMSNKDKFDNTNNISYVSETSNLNNLTISKKNQKLLENENIDDNNTLINVIIQKFIDFFIDTKNTGLIELYNVRLYNILVS